MEAVVYKARRLDSVPMYDEVHKSFHVLIGDEMVEIPEDLFHKLYKESKPFSLETLYKTDVENLDPDEVAGYFIELTRSAIQYGIPKEMYLSWVEEGCDMYPEQVKDKQATIERCSKWFDQIKQEMDK